MYLFKRVETTLFRFSSAALRQALQQHEHSRAMDQCRLLSMVCICLMWRHQSQASSCADQPWEQVGPNCDQPPPFPFPLSLSLSPKKVAKANVTATDESTIGLGKYRRLRFFFRSPPAPQTPAPGTINTQRSSTSSGPHTRLPRVTNAQCLLSGAPKITQS